MTLDLKDFDESAAQEDVAPSPASSASSKSPSSASLGKRKVQGKTAAPRVRSKQLTAVEEEEDEEEKGGLVEDE